MGTANRTGGVHADFEGGRIVQPHSALHVAPQLLSQLSTTPDRQRQGAAAGGAHPSPAFSRSPPPVVAAPIVAPVVPPESLLSSRRGRPS